MSAPASGLLLLLALASSNLRQSGADPLGACGDVGFRAEGRRREDDDASRAPVLQDARELSLGCSTVRCCAATHAEALVRASLA
jgi:hypothetical protein